jgi:hypothetical protein
MTINPNEFWDTDHSENPKLTDDLVIMAQEALGVTLPLSLIELLRIHNGGYTKGFVFPTVQPTSWAEDYVPLDELFGINPGEAPIGIHNLLDTAYMTSEWDLPPKQVLLAGQGHWWITLDYRSGDIPSVAWLDVDNDEDIQLAASFNEFLDGLLPANAVDEETCKLMRLE